jgi:hypothetical protein
MDDLTRIKKALTEIGCEKHFDKFVEQEVDWEAFLDFDKDFLFDKMKIPAGASLSFPQTLLSVERLNHVGQLGAQSQRVVFFDGQFCSTCRMQPAVGWISHWGPSLPAG